jgi:outer membrane protein assembly factor BamB
MALKRILLAVTAIAVAGSAAGSAPSEQDWFQWRGPDRTGISRETGLSKEWPQGGPKLLWSIKALGEGYGSVALKGDRIYTQGAQDGKSFVFCLNRPDGKTVWITPLGRSLGHNRGNGPRATPTVDNDRVYALSENGDLACLKAANGSVLWSRNILADFGGSNPEWLISESPLLDGNNLIVTPGGSEACIVALNKLTGQTVWKSKELSDPAGYSSCLAVDVQGVRTIIGFTAKAGVGVRASDGKLLWRYEPPANQTANCATPVFSDNKVFYTSSYGTGCGLLGLTAKGSEIKADEIYFSKAMQNHHGGVVLVNGYLYGFSGSILTCLEFTTGKVMWSNRSVGKGSLTYADGRLYLQSENNVVGLADATPTAYTERGRFDIADQGWPSWAHPVVCAGKLYIRNQAVLACYDVQAK